MKISHWIPSHLKDAFAVVGLCGDQGGEIGPPADSAAGRPAVSVIDNLVALNCLNHLVAPLNFV